MDNITLLSITPVNTNENQEEKVMDINSIIMEAVNRFMAYRDNAQKYAGYTPVLVTVNHPITVEDFEDLIRYARSYDEYTCYIENYKQQQAAERNNDKLNINWKNIFAKYNVESYGISTVKPYQQVHTIEEAIGEYINRLFENKEEITMTQNNKTESKNNETMVKEEMSMTRLQEVLMNGTKTERMVQVLEFCEQVKKVQDDRYVDKATLAQFLFDVDVVGRQLSANELKRTKRDTLIDTLRTAVQNLTNAGIITSVNTKTIEEVETMSEVKTEVANKNNENLKEEFNMEQYWNQKVATAILVGTTRGKTIKDDKRKGAGIINHMATNRYHNFISEYMLTSVIAEVLTGKALKHWDKTQKKMVDSTYSQVQIDTIKFIIEKFIERYLYQKTGDDKGYRLRADILQWCYKFYGIKTISFGVWDAVNKKWKVIYDVTDNNLVVRSTGTVHELNNKDFRKLEQDNVIFITEVK